MQDTILNRPRIAIYARYSSTLQKPSSIEDQVRLCEERAQSLGGVIVRVHSDFHATASTGQSQPALETLLLDAKRGFVDVVFAEALDRISRDQEHIHGIHKRLLYWKVRLFTLHEGEIQSIHISIGGYMNSAFLENLRAKTKRGQIGAVRAGRIPGGLCYGYRVANRMDEQGRPIRGLREIQPDEAAVIQRIYRAYADGDSVRTITAALNREGVPGPRGRLWGPTTINGHRARRNGILNNELYHGVHIYGRQEFVRDPDTGKRQARPVPRDQWTVEDPVRAPARAHSGSIRRTLHDTPTPRLAGLAASRGIPARGDRAARRRNHGAQQRVPVAPPGPCPLRQVRDLQPRPGPERRHPPARLLPGYSAMNATELSLALAQHAEAVCRHYLPKGTRQGRYWICGNIQGDAGGSLYVRLAPPGQPGKWTDEATAEHGDLLDLIRETIRASELRDAIVEAHRFLSLPLKPGMPLHNRGRRSARDTRESAHAIWRHCQPVQDTHADAYLRGRGIPYCDYPTLRFHPSLNHRDGNRVRRLPALVAAVVNHKGALTGIHRTWLDPREPRKAPCKPRARPSASSGSTRSGSTARPRAARLSPAKAWRRCSPSSPPCPACPQPRPCHRPI